jgi:hypothetical protein
VSHKKSLLLKGDVPQIFCHSARELIQMSLCLKDFVIDHTQGALAFFFFFFFGSTGV